jgi:hypothetical protein
MANELDFGPRLLEQIKANGMTINKLSTVTGLSYSAIVFYTQSKRFPNIPILVQLAKTLNCTTDYLCGLSDSPRTVERSVEASFCPMLKRCCIGENCAWHKRCGMLFGVPDEAMSSRTEQQ